MKVRSSIKKMCEFCRIVRRVSRPQPHFRRRSLIFNRIFNLMRRVLQSAGETGRSMYIATRSRNTSSGRVGTRTRRRILGKGLLPCRKVCQGRLPFSGPHPPVQQGARTYIFLLSFKSPVKHFMVAFSLPTSISKRRRKGGASAVHAALRLTRLLFGAVRAR